ARAPCAAPTNRSALCLQRPDSRPRAFEPVQSASLSSYRSSIDTKEVTQVLITRTWAELQRVCVCSPAGFSGGSALLDLPLLVCRAGFWFGHDASARRGAGTWNREDAAGGLVAHHVSASAAGDGPLLRIGGAQRLLQQRLLEFAVRTRVGQIQM